MKFAILVSDGQTADPGNAREVHVYDGGAVKETYPNPALSDPLRGIATMNSLTQRGIGHLIVADIGKPAFAYAKRAGIKVYSAKGPEESAAEAFASGSLAELSAATEEGEHVHRRVSSFLPSGTNQPRNLAG
ncbi:MAG: NifB/NifX family molybdenum-iron cluster-binding protein [Thermoprotei archaeon]|nr:NifB/NifX family molybdenum-iron cluster-binding protein [TACK group archaeon]